MILLFGGTTEGRKAVEVLEEAGTPYYYSTKTGEQPVALHYGQRVDGAMDADMMQHFCSQHGIRLLVDAAHPFAAGLHQTVIMVAGRLSIPVVRYERIYPPRSADILWIDDYSQIPRDIHTLLATTGVQSIRKLRPLEAYGMTIYYRILKRQSSIRLAHEQGVPDSRICYYEDADSMNLHADAVLLKESGLSGGFVEKVDAARARGMRIIAIKRPESMAHDAVVDGPYGLRRAVERLLPAFFPLHSGLTTGTCATAAAVAAMLQLRGKRPSEVPVLLPDGETLQVAVGYGGGHAYCMKEAGDDPDVTQGLEIRATVCQTSAPADHIVSAPVEGERVIIAGGEGVGRFTLPGFDYPPGEPAINKVPREMIRRNLDMLIGDADSRQADGSKQWICTISVPHGAEVARRTFNPRLGIEGGISILGVSGIVKPFSEEAFVGSIRKCMQVAKASGSQRVVLNSGAKSEGFLRQAYPDLPPQAFVQYGNYIGETLRMADSLHFPRVTLGVMLGKAVKLAEGQLDTHSRKSVMNRDFVAGLLDEAYCATDLSSVTLARELWEKIPAERLDDFCRAVIGHCLKHCRSLVPRSSLTILLIADDGTIHSL